MENEKDDRWIEAIHTKGWLDGQIKLHNERLKTYELNDSVCLYIPEDYILMLNGIDYVADLLGLELKEELTGYSDFPFRYSFEYKGTKFVKLSEKRIFIPPRNCEEPEDAGTE